MQKQGKQEIKYCDELSDNSELEKVVHVLAVAIDVHQQYCCVQHKKRYQLQICFGIGHGMMYEQKQQYKFNSSNNTKATKMKKQCNKFTKLNILSIWFDSLNIEVNNTHVGSIIKIGMQAMQEDANPENQYDNIMEDQIDFNSEQIDENQELNQATNLEKRTRQLQEKEEILKYSVADHQESVKTLFNELYTRKKLLLDLVIAEYNQKDMMLDLGLNEEFQEMRKKIENQHFKIAKIKQDIEMQRLGVVNNEKDAILLRQRREKLQSEVEFGRKFAASQHVRDYLERTHIHKVSYEDVKHEFEMKTKLKQYLRSEKEIYDKKKEELKKEIEREGAIKRDLQEQKARLEQSLLSKQSK